MKKVKAIILFSGGLDSILAARILTEQRIKLLGLVFKSYFFGEKEAIRMAEEIGLSMQIVDISKEQLKIVKNPKHGHGRGMNPCIDCHILMLREAKNIMAEQRFNFVATGEVLGERPMSQNRVALELIEKESSLSGYLLRPLSAKLLRRTIPEEKGLVDREKLFGFSGRSRKKQLDLAKKFKIKTYPTPAGGCLLTELEFAKRLKKLLDVCPKCQGKAVELLKLGRHFWERKTEIIVGRNEKENEALKKLAGDGDTLIEMENYPGPLTLVENYSKTKIPEQILNKAKQLTQYYSTKARDKKDVSFKISKPIAYDL